jgi:hypothetical protein
VDLCVGIDRPIEANGEEIKAGEIPGGRCAIHLVLARPAILTKTAGQANGLPPIAAVSPLVSGFWPRLRRHAADGMAA